MASGLRRSGPPEWTLSDRGERSPPERATGVDLSDRGERSQPERATGVDLGDRGERSPPERATEVDFELLPSIHLDILPDLAVRHKKPCLILERSPDF